MGENQKKKKNIHFRETFQICRSEVEQLQIYIDKKLVGFFFFFGIIIEWQLNSFHNYLIGERESHKVEESLNYYQIRFDGIINGKLKSQETLIKRWSFIFYFILFYFMENVNLQKEGKEKENKKVSRTDNMVADMTQQKCSNNKYYTSTFRYIYIYIKIFQGDNTLRSITCRDST